MSIAVGSRNSYNKWTYFREVYDGPEAGEHLFVIDTCMLTFTKYVSLFPAKRQESKVHSKLAQSIVLHVYTTLY